MNKLKNELCDFFENCIKNSNKKLLGLEVEHFIVDKRTNKAISYYGDKGVKYILQKLRTLYPNARPIVDQDIIGFSAKEFTITLEPAAQIEISINPYECISEIENIYNSFLNNINSILDGLEYKIITLSCQPVSKVNNIKIIPKKRYHMMDQYFKSLGTKGIEMMKGTCSAQVSIDYFSEDDFRKKIQVAYFLTPLFKLISNNANYFQGKKITGFLKRSEIWGYTDEIRCDMPPDIFSENFGFPNYADYLCKIPLIFQVKNNELIESGNKTANEIFKNQTITQNDILHIISMTFPDIRVKTYLEIRGADCMPFKYILGYCALIKGIFYSDSNLDIFMDMIKKYNIDKNTIELTQNNLMKYGWKGKICNISIKNFAGQVVELAKNSISRNEIKYLDPIFSIIEHEGISNIEKS